MKSFRSWGLGGLSFGLFLLTNPLFLVSCGQEDFEYDEVDMLAVVDELNQVDGLAVSSPAGLAGYELRFAVEQSGAKQASVAPRSGWISAVHACTQRSFVEEAGACMSTSELSLRGTLFVEQEGSVVETLDVTGSMIVASRLLSDAHFSFQSREGTISLEWEDGEMEPFSQVSVMTDEEGGIPTWGKARE